MSVSGVVGVDTGGWRLQRPRGRAWQGSVELMTFVRVEIPGAPVPASRPRFGKGHAYNTPKYSRYKALVTSECVLQARECNEIDGGKRRPGTALIPSGPVIVCCYFDMPLPRASHRKTLPVASEPHTKRPDIDNLVKSLLDGASGVLFHDDSQVYSLYATKRVCAQGSEPKAVITVEQRP